MRKTCFVIMPIADVETYEKGHFWRVYELIIKPACLAAGFKPIRADQVQRTNYIIIDILRKIVDAEMAVCDVSSRNPNVLYELGIRQAFNLPVTLIKDSKTPRLFDIAGLRDIEYGVDLTSDAVDKARRELTRVLKNTSRSDPNEVNSIIQLLGLRPAALPVTGMSRETYAILDAIGEMHHRIEQFAGVSLNVDLEVTPLIGIDRVVQVSIHGMSFQIGDRVKHPTLGMGTVSDLSKRRLELYFATKERDEERLFLFFEYDWDEIRTLKVLRYEPTTEESGE